MLLHDIVLLRAGKDPGAVAVIDAEDNSNRMTYGELAAGIRRMAGALIAKGFKKGARLGILSRNSIGFVEAFFAASLAGGAAVPLNYTAPPNEIRRVARDAGIAGLYIGKGFKERARAIARAAGPGCFILEGTGDGQEKVLPRRAKAGGMAAIVYTSGTTGEPLGVMLSHKNLLASAKSVVKYAHLVSKDSVLCVLPFYYIYGLSVLLSHLVAGGTVVIENRFLYPATVLDSAEKFKVTGFAGVSSHYRILLDRTDMKRRRLVSIRYFMQAGDRMPPLRVKELAAAFPHKKIFLMYGQTEASPRLTYLDPRLAKVKPGSVGRPAPGVRLKIVDKKGKECAAGIAGEVIVRGDNVMLGYWRKKRETMEALRNGWLYTKDMGYKDKDGDLFLVGREKDFIKVGGRKFSSKKAAPFIARHPDIFESSIMEMSDRGVVKKGPVNP